MESVSEERRRALRKELSDKSASLVCRNYLQLLTSVPEEAKFRLTGRSKCKAQCFAELLANESGELKE